MNNKYKKVDDTEIVKMNKKGNIPVIAILTYHPVENWSITKYPKYNDNLHNPTVEKIKNNIDIEKAAYINPVVICMLLENLEVEYFINDFEDEPIQPELFPTFKVPTTANIKRDVVLSIVSPGKIKEKYPHLLNLSLAGEKKTLSQLLDEMENWYKNLEGEDYGNWIKVFLFARAVKDTLQNEPDTIDLFEERDGVYRFIINVDKRFYNFFEDPIGNKNGTKYHTDKQKKKIIKWLEKNNDTIEFPIIASLPNKKKAIIPRAGKVFSFKKALRDDGKQLLFFSIDTNVLDDEFKNYISFSRADIDTIEKAWKEINPKHGTETLKSFIDIPLRFYTALKLLYNRNAIITLSNGLITCKQPLSKENLDTELGGLDDRIQKFLISRDRIRTGKTSEKPKAIKRLILETTFKIAKDKKWLFLDPTFNGNIYTFYMNPGKFDRKETARQLQAQKPMALIADNS